MTLRRYQYDKIKSAIGPRHSLSSATTRQLREVHILPSWDQSMFEAAYKQNLPARLSRPKECLPPACSKWFIHNHDQDFDLFPSSLGGDNDRGINVPSSSELRTSFWADHDSTFVPLELTTKEEDGGEHFERIEAPLEVLLAFLSKQPGLFGQPQDSLSIYLAQCDLSSLPDSLQADVPVPSILRPSSSADIKGDIYSSSLWLGRPPTYTPLHRDPNPNLFIQLAGRKTIRLLPPDLGEVLYHDMMAALFPGSATFSSKIRGEEMMTGPEKKALHDVIWDETNTWGRSIQTLCLETTLGLGDTLFTPKGWWHSVKGIGDGVTASVNWWFR